MKLLMNMANPVKRIEEIAKDFAILIELPTGSA
jgi:hypothetical protein